MILSGKELAAEIRAALRQRVQAVQRARDFVPGLAVILVGDDPASDVYVRGKQKAAAEIGMYSELHRMDRSSTASEIRRRIEALAQDDKLDGILVQLPLPQGLEAREILLALPPEKDVDGLHPQNLGLLFQGRPRFVSCTPRGVMALLAKAGTELQGARAVVVGRSEMVGKPMAMLLLMANATVTICHSQTRDLAHVTREAEVLVVAAGRRHLIGADHVAPGATVIDVGVHRSEGGLSGDVDTAAVQDRVRAITPVPGGVGPMTIAMLLQNTVEAAERGL